MSNFCHGAIYSSFEEAEEALLKFCKDNCLPINRDTKRTVANFNKLVKQKIVDVPESTIQCCRYVCKHYGVDKNSLATQRKFKRASSTLKKSCNDLLHLEEVLGRPNVHFKILVDDDGVTLKGVMWSSSEQLELLSQYGGVILMDSTFKVNSQGFPLFTLLVTDAFGIGQPVAHCLLQREDIPSISEFLVWLKEGLNKAIFVIDKDSAGIGAIRNTFSGSSIFLCRFHMLKAFLEELNKHKFPEERRSKIYGIFENMVKCSS
ncbi:uncharacterized protein LOC136081650 [Hydra vulgaris]|uniref:Uncharacterized protein LOC136081650 n=1 Tax=Hydra vulgaris TaxID=6087 RepID=A0ABM4C189_HYDVU